MAGSSAEIPFTGVVATKGPKVVDPAMMKSSTIQDICYVSVCTKSERLYVIFEAINKNILLPIFGCKVGQTEPIEMKL